MPVWIAQKMVDQGRQGIAYLLADILSFAGFRRFDHHFGQRDGHGLKQKVGVHAGMIRLGRQGQKGIGRPCQRNGLSGLTDGRQIDGIQLVTSPVPVRSHP